ncbi:hypothetical protein ACFFRR_003868 [Megaselia abdita]
MSSYSFQGRSRVWIQRDEEENQKIFGNGRLDGIYPNEIPKAEDTIDEEDNDRWPVKQLIKLLRLYGSHRCLWDLEDPFNKNRIERRAAMIDIKEAMNNGMTMEQLAQKINVVRSTYRYEKRRIKERIKRGQGARTKLKWFALADAFLRRKTGGDSDLEDAVVFTIDPETLIEELVPESQNYISIGPPGLLSNSNSERKVSQKNQEINKILEKKKIKDWFSGIKVASFEPSLHILKAYQEQNCLWNPRNPGFHDKHERDRALKIIGKSLEEPLDLKKVELKLKEIHFLFKKEMRKESCSRGKWFKAGQFLGPYFSSNFPIKRTRKKWTEKDTLKFVELFRDNFCLWGDHDESVREDTVNEAIASISKNMRWSKDKIRRQVKILNSTYSQEKDKILKYPGYKPKFVWFPIVDSFMSRNSSPPLSPEVFDSEVFSPPLPRISQDDIKWTPPGDNLLDGKWSLKQSVKFLRLYGAHRCLWDLKDPDYRNKLLREAALEDIASCMGHGLDAKFVDKKVKIFRITYMQERKRLVDLLKENKEPEIQLKWFPLADCFLRPHIGLRAFKETDPELPQFNYQYVYSNLNIIDPELLNSFEGKGSQNFIKIGGGK